MAPPRSQSTAPRAIAARIFARVAFSFSCSLLLSPMLFGNSSPRQNGPENRAAKANLASAATHATDRKPRAQGRVRGATRFSGQSLTNEFPKGIAPTAHSVRPTFTHHLAAILLDAITSRWVGNNALLDLDVLSQIVSADVSREDRSHPIRCDARRRRTGDYLVQIGRIGNERLE